jgi:hypothetical protein
MPAIPSSIVLTNAMATPHQIYGLDIFEVAEVRTVDLASFLVPQQAAIWNAITVALSAGQLTSGTAGFAVTETDIGQQTTYNNGGQDVMGTITPE